MPRDQWEKYLAGKPQPHSRLFLAALELRDADGHDRIVMKVAPDGTPSVQFLDASGKVVRELPAKNE
jgi:hypothetical protein